MYPTLMKLEDFKENETTIIYYYTKNGIHKYRCIKCGNKEVMINDDVCPNCKRKIL